ncbi:hypothetical protein F511_07950 [Dorcoceras hygrometricum]|uniref:Bet v I/Major latex protein domain-containing protein n=1 Tax=Dorcoceras hygrometricum TaxID=472368 RepID=A0A2Z7C8C4_9LAMI|nr:hypothetical protein F511_07950 [Dorcoceras hygrometricum]
MASTFALEAELKSKPQKIWESINDFTNLFPKIFPQVFASVVALKGDGNSPGSVRRITYAEDSRIEEDDEQSKNLSSRWFKFKIQQLV